MLGRETFLFDSVKKKSMRQSNYIGQNSDGGMSTAAASDDATTFQHTSPLKVDGNTKSKKLESKLNSSS